MRAQAGTTTERDPMEALCVADRDLTACGPAATRAERGSDECIRQALVRIVLGRWPPTLVR